MLELIAQGTEIDSRWRRPLPNQAIELGRETQAYRVPWDSQISRRHVQLMVGTDMVKVHKFPEAVNPVFFNGQEQDSFIVKPGEHFVIGKTTFTVAADRAFVSVDAPNPISQKTYSHEFLRKVPYRDADRRIDVLNRIPEAISSAGNQEDLLIQMVNTLIAGIASASTVGIVQLLDSGSESQEDPAESIEEGSAQVDQPESNKSINIIQWDRRGLDGEDFQPSATLIRQAIQTGETVLHVWNQGKRSVTKYTYDYANDWAFVSPISNAATRGWGIYVAGTNRATGSTKTSGSGEPDLQGDIKFCELVGSTLKNLLLVKRLENQQASLRNFFSPIVLDAFAGKDTEDVLAPRKCDVSVLFCDLRGFSKTSEQMADRLLELLARVSDSLGLMTNKILAYGGVIGDFHGDSAMGFWGWPLEPSDKSESAVAAVMAALEIQTEVANSLPANANLQNFQIGLGIASGPAVAGKIGTRDQVKVTAFGPVVNRASRLEGMTRWLKSSVLVDAATAKLLDSGFTAERRPITRQLGTFLPFGMENPSDVYQVFSNGAIPDDSLEIYEQALKCFQSGDWTLAEQKIELLGHDDSARQFMTEFMARYQGQPPSDWDGIVRMKVK